MTSQTKEVSPETLALHHKIKAMYQGKFKLVSHYTGYHDNIYVRCTKCNNRFATPYITAIGNALRCRHCDIAERIEAIDGYTVIGKCTIMHADVEIQHECGHRYTVRPNNFINQHGSRCPKCKEAIINSTGEKFSITEFKALSDLLYPNGITRINSYVDSQTNVNLTLRCGCTVDILPHNMFTTVPECPACGALFGKKTVRKTNEMFTGIIRFLNNTFVPLSPYITNKDKVTFLHTTCGNRFDQRPNDFLRNFNCTKCSSQLCGRDSQAEIEIANYLKNNNIEFVRNFSTPEIRYKNPLRFDFAIFNGENIQCFIEFDGKQHFQPMFSNTEFEKQQIRDTIKTESCAQRNIPLYRLSYLDYDRGLLAKKLDELFND